MPLDEVAAGFHLLSHQHAEQVVGRGGVVHRHPQERAIGRVERRVPQLFGIHFAKTLEPGDRQTLFPGPADGRQETPQVLQADLAVTATERIPRILGARAVLGQERFRAKAHRLEFLEARIDASHLVQVDHNELVIAGVGRGARRGVGVFFFSPTHRQFATRRLLLRLHEGFQLVAAGEPVLLDAIVNVVHRQLAVGRIPSVYVVPQADAALFERHKRILEPRERPAELLHLLTGYLPAISRHEYSLAQPLIEQLRLHLLLGLHVIRLLLRPHAKQRRLGDVDVAGGHELIHLAVEKCQQERANVGAVDVGVGHDHNLVIPAFAKVCIDSNAGTDRRDHAPHLLVGEHLVVAAFVGVDDLAAERQDRLKFPAAATLGRAAGRITLHQVDLALLHVATGAVAEFAGQAAARKSAFSLPKQRLRLERRRPGLSCKHPLLRDRLGTLGIFLEVLGEKFSDCRIDDPFDLAVAELRLRLPFELRMGHPHADHGGEPLADVVAGGNEILIDAGLLAVGVERAGERRAVARDVRAAFGGRDVVDVAVDVLGVFSRVLQRDVPRHALGLAPDRDHIGVDRIARTVQPLDEFDHAPLVAILFFLAADRVGEGDPHARVQKR